MITLIAESKTMLNSEKEFSYNEIAENCPVYDSIATEIMCSMKNMTVGEIASTLKISPSLAANMKKMIYDFEYKATGNFAIDAYTGVVFKFLNFETLDTASKERCLRGVKIISSLYGWLQPSDIIKSYRLDFMSKLPEGPSENKSLNSFWKMDVTKALVKTLKSSGDSEVLNLLPSDAAKCIDWKLVKRFAKVWKVDFKEIKEEGHTKTPSAERLKKMRGLLLRQIIKENIQEAGELLHTVSDEYVCEGTPVYPDHFQFLC